MEICNISCTTALFIEKFLFLISVMGDQLQLQFFFKCNKKYNKNQLYKNSVFHKITIANGFQLLINTRYGSLKKRRHK